MMDFSAIKTYVETAKASIDLLKAAVTLIPKSAQRDEIESKVDAAKDALDRNDVKLAHELGYLLCKCTFPPQIMLWKEAEKSYVCPNSVCDRKKVQWQRSPDSPGESWKTA